jgi:hypothetical protein
MNVECRQKLTAERKSKKKQMQKQKQTTTKTSQNTTTSSKKPKEEEEADKCSICLEVLPKFSHQYNRFACCGNGIHHQCCTDLMSITTGLHCPLCRAETPTTIEDALKELRPWVKKGKVWQKVWYVP